MREIMADDIKPGNECLLDGKTVVKVIKPLNRSNSMFSIEIDGRSILTVEKSRLQPIHKNSTPENTQ